MVNDTCLGNNLSVPQLESNSTCDIPVDRLFPGTANDGRSVTSRGQRPALSEEAGPWVHMELQVGPDPVMLMDSYSVYTWTMPISPRSPAHPQVFRKALSSCPVQKATLSWCSPWCFGLGLRLYLHNDHLFSCLSPQQTMGFPRMEAVVIHPCFLNTRTTLGVDGIAFISCLLYKQLMHK